MCPDFISSGLLRTCRQCVRCVTLLAYLLVTSGVSLPQIGFDSKQASESFPCAGRGCGCATAEQCWRQCCCTSLENRLGWANQKKIQPPEWITHFPGEVPPTLGRNHSRANCSSEQPVTCAHASQNASTSPKTQPMTFVGSLRCKGSAAGWLVTGSDAPLLLPLDLRWDDCFCGKVCVVTFQPRAYLYPPPLPPPKISIRLLLRKLA